MRKPTYWIIRKSTKENIFMAKEGGWTEKFSETMICLSSAFKDAMLEEAQKEAPGAISVKCVWENAI